MAVCARQNSACGLRLDCMSWCAIDPTAAAMCPAELDAYYACLEALPDEAFCLFEGCQTTSDALEACLNGTPVDAGTGVCNRDPGVCTLPGTADDCRNGAVCERPCPSCDYACEVACSTDADCAGFCSGGAPLACNTPLPGSTGRFCGPSS